jgi:hypothetical protein
MSNRNEKGITLLIAVLTVGLLLSISLSIFNIAMKELIISSSGKDSHIAFYAADTGIECALYWDYRGAFFEESEGSIVCGDYNSAGDPNYHPYEGRWQFTINLPNSTACALVSISKIEGETRIESRGHNTCMPSTRRTERGIRVKY